MKIKSVSFSNFKYVAKERKMKLDLPNSESLIMGGPNGYGKTTVFDALELLITGKIRHFNSDLPNRGKESIAVLANDSNSDIWVAAEFISENVIILVERRFVSSNNFESSLMMNNEPIDNEKLFSILGISKYLFELGTYISQIDSLNFLQQKYKTRKESITGILDSSDIENRFSDFKIIQESLKTKFEQEEKEDKAKLSELDSERVKIGDALKILQLSQEDIPYLRLFEHKEYNFDKEFFDKEEVYDVIISPVDDLIEFSKYRKTFLIKKRNIEINEIIAFDKKIYTALFFKQEINDCINQKIIIDTSNELLKLKNSCQEKNFYINENIINTLELTEENVKQINGLILQKNTIETGMTATQASLTKILKQRTDFLITYNNSVIDSILPEKICPLCGRESDNLIKLFSDTESVLKSNLGLIATQLTDVIKQLTDLFEILVIRKVNAFLNLHQEIIEKNNLLVQFLQINTDKLSEKLKKEDIVFLNVANCVDFNLFEEKYVEIINKLSSNIGEVTEVVSEELYAKLLRISIEYYSHIESYDEQVLIKKKFYISALFSNSLNIKLKAAENNYILLDTKIKNKKSRFDRVFENISTIIKKYDTAKKQYQSSIAKNIAVPMFVFSGKIIQNYPLGLGVLIQVENNAIVFKTGNMKSDIFNNLSTGQLNGVVISLLLSIKEIFTTSNSLNTLLIDDPLQTIDDISAISLIDLLSEHFGDTQILLSTHEDDKQFLMKKKYEQSGKKCKVVNMQKEYLSQ
jgi:ABC-type Mn2+/Zn2+ transport system ATPase subunit